MYSLNLFFLKFINKFLCFKFLKISVNSFSKYFLDTIYFILFISFCLILFSFIILL